MGLDSIYRQFYVNGIDMYEMYDRIISGFRGNCKSLESNGQTPVVFMSSSEVFPFAAMVY